MKKLNLIFICLHFSAQLIANPNKMGLRRRVLCHTTHAAEAVAGFFALHYGYQSVQTCFNAGELDLTPKNWHSHLKFIETLRRVGATTKHGAICCLLGAYMVHNSIRSMWHVHNS